MPYRSFTVIQHHFVTAMVFKALSATFFFLAKKYYRPVEQDSDKGLNFDGNFNDAYENDAIVTDVLEKDERHDSTEL